MDAALSHPLWKEFHGRAEALPAGVLSEAQQMEFLAFLEDFDARVNGILKETQAACGCGTHWERLRKLFPPCLETGRQAYLWTVHMHNQVNIRLGKFLWGPGPELLERGQSPVRVLLI